MAYLGFQKGGGKFLLATIAHTNGGQTKFSNFFSVSNKKKFGQRGTMAQCPLLNTPLFLMFFIFRTKIIDG